MIFSRRIQRSVQHGMQYLKHSEKSLFGLQYGMQAQYRMFSIGIPSDLKISERAGKQLELLNRKKEIQQLLRIQIDAGGCHG